MPSPAPPYAEYYPDGWADLSAGGTPIDAAALNRMESGIKAAMPAPLNPNSQDLPIWNAAANGGAGGWDTTSNLKIPKTAIQSLSITDADIAPAAGIQSSKLAGSFPISKLAGYPGDATKFLRGDGVWGNAADKSSASQQIFTGSVFSGNNPAYPTTLTGSGLTAAGKIRAVVSGTTVGLEIGSANGTDAGARLWIKGDGTISWLADDTTLGWQQSGVLSLAGSLVISGYVNPTRVIAKASSIAYATTITPNVGLGEFFYVGATGAITVANPTGVPATSATQRFAIEIYNATAGTLTPSWGTALKGAGGTTIAAGLRCTFNFIWHGALVAWVCTGISPTQY